MKMSSSFASRRLDQRAANDADQVEFNAIVRETSVIDVGTFDDRIAGAQDDFDPGDAEEDMDGWQRSDLINDISVGNAQAEIERRIELLGGAYPFELSGNSLSYKKRRSSYYEFCLAISVAPSITAGEFVELPRQFERTSAVLLKLYMGEDSYFLHTGWPRDPHVGVRFKQAMTNLSQLSGEWIWGPRFHLGDDPEPANVKDEGLDFIVWKKSLDRRLGSLFILAQCACGNDWDQKLTELTVDRLGRWFNTPSLVGAMRSFVTPYILSDGNFRDALEKAGLVFDRIRLVLIAERCHGQADILAMRTKIDDLSAKVLV